MMDSVHWGEHWVQGNAGRLPIDPLRGSIPAGGPLVRFAAQSWTSAKGNGLMNRSISGGAGRRAKRGLRFLSE